VRDKGYAWFVIALMFTSNVVTAGYIKGFGVFYNEIAKAYPGTSEAAGGAVMALLAGCRSMMALGVGAAAVTYGARPVMLCGVALCSSGLLLSFLCTSVPQLALTLGAMMGAGMCAIETCQVHILSDYFNKKKELANSLRVTGNPLGGATMPFLVIFLVDAFGLKLTYIALSGVLLQLGVLVCLMRPYEVHQRIVQASRVRKLRRKTDLERCEHEMFELTTAKASVAPAKEKAKRVDLSLLKQPLYLTHLAMITGLSVALPQLQYFLPRFGDSIGMTQRENSAVLAYQSVFDSTTRFVIGLLLNKKLFKKTNCFAFTLLVGGAGICLIPFARGVWGCLVGVTLFSLGSSGFFATINVILLDQFGRANVSSSWGFIRMLQGILNFVYPPILGYMRDATGGFVATFLTMGGGMAFGGLMVALQPCVLRATGSSLQLQ